MLALSFGYDDFVARITMTDGEGQTTYSYNNLRQLESETRTFTGLSGNYYKLSYSYNVVGQPTQVNYGVYTLSGGGNPVYSFNKNVNYDYNGVSALKGIGTNLLGSNPNTTTNVISAATYRAGGAVNVLSYGNGRRLTMGYYQQRSQPASMKVDLASNPADKIIDYSYDYNDATGANNNRIRKITDNVDGGYTTTYTYDQYNRLTLAASSAYNGSFQYDEFGNIKNYQGMTINYATNASGAPATNRISTAVAGGVTYTHSYDNAGNLTNDGSQSYVYDGANRLKQAGSSGQSTYGYDGDGARVRKTEAGAALFYVRSSVLGAVTMEVNSGGVVRAYVYSNGKLVAELASDNNFYWIHKDHLGSGRKLTDSSGALQFRSEYSAYGQLLLNWSASGATNPSTRKFTGYERDAATGLDYASARMYGSSYGRFTSPDPAGQKATDSKRPQSLNRYSYVENDPVNFRDPSGKLLAPAGGGDGCITYYLDGIFWFNTCGSLPIGSSLLPSSGGGGSSSPIRVKPSLYTVQSFIDVKPCGDVKLSVDWHVFGGFNSQEGINGWVVQHIRSFYEVLDENGKVVKDANGNPLTKSKDFYEAWEVVNGIVINGDTFQFRLPAARGTSGSYHVMAVANFVWKDELNPSPPNWKGTEPDAFGGLNTPDKPSGWSDNVGKRRTLDYTWNCTDPDSNKYSHTFSATP
ncbi:MAG TPA: RHS repeat-associated core domain-containing protein [Blastocatellia bacterium]|nr:RHS repeat-associated core domain-containing protein [Blastocatellia bacterium]HMZ17753.1 RHS repeat-associated core domain-containing protein [Blastocatellia bacterium]HNG33770.1 RHS repeat-associated core domain-containing protein [Blastocatellia bacterium]